MKHDMPATPPASAGTAGGAGAGPASDRDGNPNGAGPLTPASAATGAELADDTDLAESADLADSSGLADGSGLADTSDLADGAGPADGVEVVRSSLADGTELEPIVGEPTTRHDELDQLAARLVNGELTGRPVSDAVDLGRIERAVREILIALGEDPDRDGLRRTPARVARAYAELFAGLRVDPADVLTTTFESCHEEFVLVRDIEVFSLCEHHLLPFHGVAHIGYIPGMNGRITGLSKLARLVEVYSRRPQVQERLTSQVADLLLKSLDARGVIVVLDCEHMCMAMRGIQKTGARTVTSAVRGLLQGDPKSRAEAMSLIMRG
jgi:GTP cyclohydrolase I